MEKNQEIFKQFKRHFLWKVTKRPKTADTSPTIRELLLPPIRSKARAEPEMKKKRQEPSLSISLKFLSLIREKLHKKKRIDYSLTIQSYHSDASYY